MLALLHAAGLRQAGLIRGVIERNADAFAEQNVSELFRALESKGSFRGEIVEPDYDEPPCNSTTGRLIFADSDNQGGNAAQG